MDTHAIAIDTPDATARPTVDYIDDITHRARTALEARLADLGLGLFVSDDWAELEAVNLRNRNSWGPLLQTATLPAFWAGVRDRDGDVVATYAAKRLDCTAKPYAQHLQDLTLFYDDPSQAPTGELCFVGGYSPAWTTRGRFAFLTAAWNHPSQRGRGLFHLIGRTVMIEAWHRWEPHWWGGVVEPRTRAAWDVARAGRRHLDERPTILYQQPGEVWPPLHFMRMSRQAFLLNMADVARGGAVAAVAA